MYKRQKDGTVTVAEVPAKALTEMAPCYSRETSEPTSWTMKSAMDILGLPEPSDYREALKLVLSSPKIACKRDLWMRASSDGCGKDLDSLTCSPNVQVIRGPGTNKGLRCV